MKRMTAIAISHHQCPVNANRLQTAGAAVGITARHPDASAGLQAVRAPAAHGQVVVCTCSVHTVLNHMEHKAAQANNAHA
jgi:hypothetical protein